MPDIYENAINDCMSWTHCFNCNELAALEQIREYFEESKELSKRQVNTLSRLWQKWRDSTDKEFNKDVDHSHDEGLFYECPYDQPQFGNEGIQITFDLNAAVWQ